MPPIFRRARRDASGPPVVIFDFDGVIADSFDVFFQAFSSVCSDMGFHRLNSEEAMLKLFEGNALRELNRPAESASAYLEALTMRPDNEDLADNICTALKDCTDHKRRLKILTRAAKVTNQQHPRILLGLALALFDGGQKEEAQSVARKAMPMIAERFDSILEAEAKALRVLLEGGQ